MPTSATAASRNILFLLVLIVVSSGMVGCLGRGAPKPDARATPVGATIVREDQSFELGKDIAVVEIDNPYGEINVRDHDQAEVGVHAVGQRVPGTYSGTRLVASRESGALKLKVVLAPGAADGRYDMSVFVSKDVPLLLRGGKFRVDARKRNARLTITTLSGKINASSHNVLDLSTDSGTIQAAQLDQDWTGTSRLRSKSGQIVAMAPLSGNVSLVAETGGEMSTNFGLTIHKRAQGGHRASAQYGSGASHWQIESESGEVVIEQAVILGEDMGSSEDSD